MGVSWVSFLPLARELKVVPVRMQVARKSGIETPPVSWLGEEFRTPEDSGRNPGRPSQPGSEIGVSLRGSVARAGKRIALQSRGGDGFAPSSRARSLG